MALTSCINIYAKVLQRPSTTVKDMVKDMRNIYNPHGFQVNLMSVEEIELPLFMDLDVGTCSNSLTSSQLTLFGNRNSTPPDGIVIYFVRTVIGSSAFLNGCAAHASGLPSAVIAQFASRWTLGHEIGHLLGLSHTAGQNQLMTESGTFSLGNSTPILSSEEASRIRSSTLLKPYP